MGKSDTTSSYVRFPRDGARDGDFGACGFLRGRFSGGGGVIPSGLERSVGKMDVSHWPPTLTAAGTQQPGKEDLGSPFLPPQDHTPAFREGLRLAGMGIHQ